jgi:hypothetical protein
LLVGQNLQKEDLARWALLSFFDDLYETPILGS